MDPAIVSAIIAAATSALVTTLIAFVRARREDSIRADEREQAAKVLQEERENSNRVRKEDRGWDAQLRLDERNANALARRQDEDRAKSELTRNSGATEARKLLDLLGDMQAHFDRQDQRQHGTYSYSQEVSRTVLVQVRLIPDPEVREFVILSVQAINHTWVIDSTDGIASGISGQAAQRRTLADAMDIVGAYVRGEDNWDRMGLEGLRAVTKEIDSAYEFYYKDPGG